MKIVITTIVCTLLFVLIGCSPEQTPTEVPQVPAESSVKDQPADTGAIIFRFQGGYGAVFYDFGRGLQAIIGIDVNDFCAGTGIYDIVNVMEVINPLDRDLINQLLTGSDMNCFVYPLYPFDCERFVAEGPIASGFVNLNSTDNDYWAFLESRTAERVNTFKTSAQGDLYTPEGQKVMFNFQSQTVWTGYPDMEFIRESTDIFLAVTGRR